MTGESFEDYCDRMQIAEGEEPAAFAAWLHQETGWDGPMGQVSPETS